MGIVNFAAKPANEKYYTLALKEWDDGTVLIFWFE